MTDEVDGQSGRPGPKRGPADGDDDPETHHSSPQIVLKFLLDGCLHRNTDKRRGEAKGGHQNQRKGPVGCQSKTGQQRGCRQGGQ